MKLSDIRHGDKVTILIPNGIGRNGQEWKEKTGTAVMLGPAGWVLNMGGRYGTPGVATEKNFVRAKKGLATTSAGLRKPKRPSNKPSMVILCLTCRNGFTLGVKSAFRSQGQTPSRSKATCT